MAQRKGEMTDMRPSGGGKTRLTFVQSGFTTPRTPYAGWMGTLAGLTAAFVGDGACNMPASWIFAAAKLVAARIRKGEYDG